MFYVYILECNDLSLYTGYTNNLENRIKKHNSKLGAKYTRSRIPVKLKYFELYLNKSDALKREAEIKKMSRKQKIKLINEKDS